MSNNLTSNTCKEHTGFNERIGALEDNVSKLWEKWDWAQKVAVGALITLSFNLIGIIALIFKIYIK